MLWSASSGAVISAFSTLNSCCARAWCTRCEARCGEGKGERLPAVWAITPAHRCRRSFCRCRKNPQILNLSHISSCPNFLLLAAARFYRSGAVLLTGLAHEGSHERALRASAHQRQAPYSSPAADPLIAPPRPTQLSTASLRCVQRVWRSGDPSQVVRLGRSRSSCIATPFGSAFQTCSVDFLFAQIFPFLLAFCIACLDYISVIFHVCAAFLVAIRDWATTHLNPQISWTGLRLI